MSSSSVGSQGTEPDPSEYQHLTNKQRMLAGYPYKSSDEELVRDRIATKRRIAQFNRSDVDEDELRRSILKELFHHSCKDKNISIELPFRCDYGYNIIVGDNFDANYDCIILDAAEVRIGDNCMLAPCVHIYAGTHPLEGCKRRQNNTNEQYDLARPVTIGNDVWIGGNSTICPGVVIGDNVVVGAGSVVVKSVPSNVVVAGNPAKIIRHLRQ